MSSIREFYIEKEKRELINTINSAKYISEEQKEAMIAEISPELLKRAEKASDKRAAGHAKRHSDIGKQSAKKGYSSDRAQAQTDATRAKEKEYKRGSKFDKARQRKITSRSDAQKYYDEKGRAPEGWHVFQGKVDPR